MSKKKFKDTKVGKFLALRGPHILEAVGDLVPDAGVLGAIGEMIKQDNDLTEKDKEAAARILEQEIADRDSARKREAAIAEYRKFDLLFNLTGLTGLAAFGFLIYAIVYLEIPEQNKEVWIHLIGICEGIVLSIFGYFFGSAIKKNTDG